MTIFQRILILPLLSLVLYSCFLLYSYQETQQGNRQIEKIRDDFLPLLELTNENIGLFNQISDTFKDAVTASEQEWVQDNNEPRTRIKDNLAAIAGFPHLVPPELLQRLDSSFENYYRNAEALSLALLKADRIYLVDAKLIERVEFFHVETSTLLTAMKTNIHREFKQTVDQTHRDQRRLILIGGAMAAVLLVALASTGLVNSLSIRKRLFTFNKRMEELAGGTTDFSRRLEQDSRDELGELAYWFNQLSDKMEQDYKKIELISITDKLTGLNNRQRTDVFFSESIAKAQTSAAPLSIILLDIDHFKSINDRFGHLEGDRVLVAIADILKDSAQPGDFIGRWGGEEFVLVLPGKSLDEASDQAEILRQAVQSHAIGDVGSITASFGVAVLSNADTMDSLIKRADTALYAAKTQGRNRVICG